ncbi:Retrotransposon, Pao [Cinara cedri]|uniref:Retrotransposon, Pao n=1 Tax=Cinara cedri TaxID=506608 RepID=A0A5E4MMQ6_9HEMI|nr:Retrotransposon, Pao [Cinara cedri]
MSKNLARQLQLPTVKASMPVSGIGANTVRTSTAVDVHVESRVGQFVFVATSIMSKLPPVRTPDVGWTIPNELLPCLADPRFHESKQIDLLIGGGAFFDILQPERVQLDVRTLYLQDRWLVTGEMSNTCLLSIGETMEEDWKTSLSNDDTTYGKSSKANAEQDWDLQRILWREKNASEILRTYQLVTVTYGTTPASFMSTQCLVALARQSSDEFPCASNAIARDFYMDDLMTGGETQEECIRLYHEITEILNSARLPLRKWCSNSALVLEHIGKDVRDPLFTLELGDEEMVKSLGLCWKPVPDEFTFTVTPMPIRSRLTKRALLSNLNKVFDPLGLVSPILLKGKIFLQQIWAMKTDCDSLLSKDIQERWRLFVQDLELLQNVLVPRKALPEAGEEIQIHGFSDASQEAYGACIYVRSRSKGDSWHVRLLCSKTRVAPL